MWPLAYSGGAKRCRKANMMTMMMRVQGHLCTDMISWAQSDSSSLYSLVKKHRREQNILLTAFSRKQSKQMTDISIFRSLCMIKTSCLYISFPMCLWVTGVCIPVRLCVLDFCIECSLVRCLQQKKKPFSCQVKSPGRLTSRSRIGSSPNTAGYICTVLMYIENIYFVLPADHKTIVW